MNKVQSGYFKLTLLALLVLTLSLLSRQVAQAETNDGITKPAVPDNLKAPAGQIPILKVSAKGVQIYICTANATDPAKFEWTLKAPEAELFNEKGEKLGKHYAGPTWEALDGSKVTGELKEKANAPDSKGIPWLLLKAKSNEGNGLFSKVASIQRVDTVGGFAPDAANCDQARKASEVRVAYSATYYFNSPGGAVNPVPSQVPATGQGGGKKADKFPDFPLPNGLALVMMASLSGLLILTIVYKRNKLKTQALKERKKRTWKA